MTDAEVLATIRTVLTTTFQVPDDEVTPEATLEQLEMDSLALAEFALVLEERLGVRLRGEQATRSTTLAEVAAHVRALRDGSVAAR
ncbi:hypothetical protein GCM10010218_58440 [Streptomyces mashuensis]|uniref:Carrier domain-containing protein n=1 Tax=Streptomyces mashuensis TaxID=33904 RepID=A0A919B948_9ACTN|nr:acyl carrier protein [Streptomyces mashuensis]GHF69344.1 hypothetical protein GCM10010218_58440 [Streptomyces mashuensis]